MNSFFLNGTTTTEIYTLSLHDALPIRAPVTFLPFHCIQAATPSTGKSNEPRQIGRHTSELQSLTKLVCRLLLEKKQHRSGPAPTAALRQSAWTSRRCPPLQSPEFLERV